MEVQAHDKAKEFDLLRTETHVFYLVMIALYTHWRGLNPKSLSEITMTYKRDEEKKDLTCVFYILRQRVVSLPCNVGMLPHYHRTLFRLITVSSKSNLIFELYLYNAHSCIYFVCVCLIELRLSSPSLASSSFCLFFLLLQEIKIKDTRAPWGGFPKTYELNCSYLSK